MSAVDTKISCAVSSIINSYSLSLNDVIIIGSRKYSIKSIKALDQVDKIVLWNAKNANTNNVGDFIIGSLPFQDITNGRTDGNLVIGSLVFNTFKAGGDLIVGTTLNNSNDTNEDFIAGIEIHNTNNTDNDFITGTEIHNANNTNDDLITGTEIHNTGSTTSGLIITENTSRS